MGEAMAKRGRPIPIQSSLIKPDGVLDYNTSLDIFREGNLSYSINTRMQNSQYNSLGERWCVPGTTLAYTGGSVTQQNKIFRFYFDNTRITPLGAGDYTAILYSPNAASLVTIPVVTAYFAIGIVMSNFILDATADFAAAFQTVTFSAPVTTSPSTGYIDIEVTTVSLWDYYWVLSVSGFLFNIDVIQEALDVSAAGTMKPWATKDLLGDLFQIWTTKKDGQTSAVITSGVNNGSGLYLITTATPHGINNGSLTVLTGVPQSAQGQWIIQVISTTSFVLQGSIFAANFTGGTAFFNTKSMSEIGVAQQDIQTLTWTYIPLLRTSEWNLRLIYQGEIGVAQDNIYRKSIYFNDHHNPDRCFYYKGAYVNFGAITAINPDGTYTYGTVEAQTRLILSNTGSQIFYQSQSVTGGGLIEGMYRYSGQFITGEGTGTTPIKSTGQIPVYSADQTASGSEISGDTGGTATTKVNNLLVTFPADTFDKFQLIAVHYIGGSQSGTLVKTVDIPPGATSLTVTHSGLETTSEDYDVGLLNKLQSVYEISRTMRSINNRNTRSNLKSIATYDLRDWFATWEHSIEFDGTMPTIGRQSNNTISFGEYERPDYVESKGGYMFFEMYRIGAVVEWINGGTSSAFWIDDILIDGNPFNMAAVPNPGTGFTNRRTGNTYSTLNLTDNNQAFLQIPYLDFHGFDWNYLVEGIPVKNLIKSISIVRIPAVREVLASGMVAMGVTDLSGGAGSGEISPSPLSGAPTNIGLFPYITGETLGTNFDDGLVAGVPEGDNALYTAMTGAATMLADRTWGFYFSADIAAGYQNFTPASGDTLRSFGAPTSNTAISVDNAPVSPVRFYGSYKEYTGFSNVGSTSYATATITDGASVGYGGTTTITATPISQTLYGRNPNTGTTFEWYNHPCLALKFSANLNNTSVNPDYGFYMAYYYRKVGIAYDAAYTPDNGKYGDRDDSRYPVTLKTISLSGLTTTGVAPSGQIKIYGQDVFTQGTYMKVRRAQTSSAGAPQHQIGFDGGVMFYSQNVVNTNLINRNPGVSSEWWQFPYLNATSWLFDAQLGNATYDPSYNYANSPVIYAAFQDNSAQAAELPASIAWSNIKVNNSFSDPFREWLPLNITELELSDGAIVHHEIVNGELFALQQRNYVRKFFNSTGTLQTLQNAEVVVGDGVLLGKRGQSISNIGCTHKFSVQVGRSKGGNDVLYWWNVELKVVVRYGYDGTNPISFVQGLEPFIRDNVRWVTNKDNPVSGEGICSTWNDINKEWIITVRGKKELGVWSSGGVYFPGNVIAYVPIGKDFFSYEQTGEIYIAGVSVVNGVRPEVVGSGWTVIPHTDNNYYNEYTLVFSEISNGFTTFMSFLPMLYAKWKDTYLSANPIPDLSAMYEHERGTEMSFYASQNVDGYAEFPFSNPINSRKNWMNIKIESELIPQRVEFRTPAHYTYMDSINFSEKELDYYGNLPHDATVSVTNPLGLNSLWESNIYGRYCKVKFKYLNNVLQKLRSIKIFHRSRYVP